jgi:hypothetical protein
MRKPLTAGAISTLIITSVATVVAFITPTARYFSRWTQEFIPLRSFGDGGEDLSEPLALKQTPRRKRAPESIRDTEDGNVSSFDHDQGFFRVLPNFDKSQSPAELLLERARRDVDRINDAAASVSARAQSDVEFLLELDR